jgi:hypothetical protein
MSKLKKCNLKICKTKMDLVNCMECTKCHEKFCLEHRLFEAHDCDVFKNEVKINELDIFKNKMKLQNEIITSLKNMVK